MKAVVVEAFRHPLTIRSMPEPRLRTPYDILVRLQATGVCHTDVQAADGDWPVRPKLPLIPGHEGVGTVETAGEMVTGLKTGDRVGIPWLHWACGQCEHCLTGWETLCESQTNTGYSVNGTFAEYAVADSRYVATVPDGLESEQVAAHLCAGLTAYKAVMLAGAGPGKTVLVSGIGGLGHLALQYARVVGARTIAVDISDEKLLLAQRLGADEMINAAAIDVASAARRLGGADIVIGTAPSPKAYVSGLSALKRNGNLVVVGLTADALPVPAIDLVLKGIRIFGSVAGTRKDLQETISLAARGLVRCRTTTAGLEEVNDVFAAVKAGKVTGCVILKISSTGR